MSCWAGNELWLQVAQTCAHKDNITNSLLGLNWERLLKDAIRLDPVYGTFDVYTNRGDPPCRSDLLLTELSFPCKEKANMGCRSPLNNQLNIL